jgi:hypothetical protein
VVVSLLVCFLLVEGVARWHLAQKQADWARLMQDERHYLRRSDDPRFGYEHDPGRVVESGGRRLAINAHGIRADSDELFPDRERIGLLGDSVTFGADPGGYLDRTDHLAAAGDRLMTEVLADLVESWAPLPE